MIKRLVILSIVSSLCILCNAQILVGKTKDDVKQFIKENHKEFSLDETSKNTTYNLLKYIDSDETQTWLLLFDDNDICQLSKLMCDYSLQKKIIKQLDVDYAKSAENEWKISEGDRHFIITLKKTDWYFTVTTKEDK